MAVIRARRPFRRREKAPESDIPTLADLRGFPDDPEWSPATERRVDEVLGALLGRLKLGERLRRHEIERSWAVVVGEFNARHSFPESLTRGVLLVRVSNAPLRHQFELLKPELLKRLKELLGPGVVNQVRFGL